MLDLGLSATEKAAYLEALSAPSVRMRTVVSLFDQDEQPQGSLVPMVVDGAVQLDASRDVSRSLGCRLLDPKRRLDFDPASPTDFAMFADRFVGVERGVYVPELERWVDAPIMKGPITNFGRQGAMVTIEAQGKESLMLAPHHATQGYKIRRRTRLDDAVRSVGRRVGEAHFDIPELATRIRRTHVVEPESEPWKVLIGGDTAEHYYVSKRQRKRQKKSHHGSPPPPPGGLVGGSGNLEAFYSAAGVLTVRRSNQNATATFGGEDGWPLISVPSFTFDETDFVNYVLVRGGRAHGAKKAARGVAFLPRDHPLSPWALARNDKPRFYTQILDADNLKSDSKCRDRAKQALDRGMRQGTAVSFDALARPDLEEGDWITTRYRGASITLPLVQATIPLSGGTWTYGANKAVAVKRGR